MFKRFKSLPYGLLALSLSGCITPHYSVSGNSDTLEGLTKVRAVKKITKEQLSDTLRIQSLKDYAFSTAAQAGCAEHTQKLQQLLNQLDKALDRVYNFNVWMLPHHVLPPVLIEAKGATTVDAQTMRVANRIYHIYKEAKFVSTPPHWRYDYLLRDASHITNKPPKLVADLLPKNEKEQAIWKKAVQEGWQCGVEQARNNFMINLHSLARDLNGMVLYRQLLAKGMIAAPYVSYSHLGITGDEKKLSIQEKISRITAPAKLNHNANQWQAIITTPEITHEPTPSPTTE